MYHDLGLNRFKRTGKIERDVFMWQLVIVQVVNKGWDD